ncbi:MAG: PKD-like domain-containing protein, partial [Bacteroidota bacterium]
ADALVLEGFTLSGMRSTLYGIQIIPSEGTTQYAVDLDADTVNDIDKSILGDVDVLAGRCPNCPVVEAGMDVTVCENETINLSASFVALPGDPDIDFWSWTGPNGYTSSSQNPSISNAMLSDAGMYEVTGTFDGGCTTTDNLMVTINPAPVVEAGDYGPFCVDAALQTLTGSPVPPPGTAVWSGTGVGDLGDGTATFDPSVAGVGSHLVVYSYTNTDGCTNMDDALIVVDALPVVNITGNTMICNTGTGASPAEEMTTLDAGTGFASYMWSPTNETSSTITVNAAGTYSVTVTDANGCMSSTQVNVTSMDCPNCPAIQGGMDISVCENDVINLTANYTPSAGDPNLVGWSWAGPNGYTSNEQNPSISTASITNGGVYTVTATFDDGCMSMDEVQVTVNALPTVDAGTYGPFCEGISAQSLSGTPLPSPGTAVWSGTGITVMDNGDGTATLDPSNSAAAGTYTITYAFTDMNGCTNSDNATIVINPTPIVSITGNTMICNPGTGDDPANRMTTLDAGTGFVNYAWSPNGETTPTITTSTPGTYTVTVTDSNNCTASAQVNVTGMDCPTCPAIQANTDIAVCENDAINLTANHTPQAGDPTVVGWSWTGPNGFTSTDQNPSISNADATNDGTYIITATFSDGCMSMDNTIVTVNALPTVEAGTYGPFCIDAGSQILVGDPLPLPGTATWMGTATTDNNDGTASFEPATAGVGSHVVTYTFTDTNGCTSMDDATIVVNALPTVAITGNTMICDAGTGASPAEEMTTLDAGAGFTSYAWSSGETTQTISTSTPGNYGVTVTDANACTASTQVTVTQGTCCNPNAGTQTASGAIAFCDSPDQSGALAGSTATIDIDFGGTPPQTGYAYAFVVTDSSLDILAVNPATTYNSAAPTNFSEGIDLTGYDVGTYCIHGISYDPASLTNPTSIVGMNAATIAPTLFENDGNPAGGSTCADLNVTGCTSVVVNPVPVGTGSSVGPICSNNVFTIDPQLSTDLAGSTFTWTAAYDAGLTGGASTGTGSVSETLTNVSATPLTATYTFTPTSDLGCVGADFAFSVTINPAPVGPVGGQATEGPICSDAPFDFDAQ